MRTKTGTLKRLLSGILCIAIAVALLAVFAVPSKAAETTQANYVSMPITIRDYAADGMLFEWNETGTGGDTSTGGATPTLRIEEARGNANRENMGDWISYTSIGASGVGNNTYITWTLGGVTRDQVRYCVIRHKTDSATYSGNKPTIGHRWGSNANYVDASGLHYNDWNNWYTTIIDLGGGSDTVSYVTLYPQLPTGKKIGIDFVAFFSSQEAAEKYVNSGFQEGGEVYHNGDTKGFGLTQTDDKDHFNDLSGDIEGTTKFSNGSWGDTSDPAAVQTTLNSGAPQTVYGALIRTNLVEPQLDTNKKLVYTEPTVTYLANLLQKTLPEVWKNSDGSYNMWYVMGAKLDDLGGADLATKLRTQITGDMGTYADARAKYEAGNLSDYTKVSTYYDAAYFLLHNTFDDSIGYGKTIPEYKTIRLVEKQVDGKTVYVFNSGYDGAVYDSASGTIYNTQTNTITTRLDDKGKTMYARGNLVPENRFDPIANMGYGKSGNTYTMARDKSQVYYYNDTNYNLTLEGHAKFIYYEDSDLYFNFTGDDDVYLFINGIRVLDMGGAHSVSKAGISLNNVATLCGLKDGEIYDFDFYYMERHGTAANFGIETNIRIVDPSMVTTKTGYQNGVSTGYNGYVDPLKPVSYEFGLKNDGEAAIKNLTFRDADIGISLSKDEISLNPETTVEMLRATVYNADGSVKEYVQEGNLTEEKLKSLLETGLEVGEQIRIYGFMHTITEPEWNAGSNTYPNRVYTTAVSYGDNSSTQTLNGTADWKVQKRTYEYAGFHVYEWVGKSVTVTKDELLQPLKDAGTSFDSSASIILCTASGNTTAANLNPNATLNGDGSITYTGTKTGADRYYYKVQRGDQVSNVIGVDVYSYGVADNTYVLDYGLAVELNGPEFGLMVNDTLYLEENPNTTSSSVTGIANATSNYGTFTWKAPSLKYTPKDIIDDIDTVTVNVKVMEEDASELTKFTGVEMHETVTTAPANVVYYEEDFPGITYVNEGENQWAHYETVDEEGKSVAGTEQSADQDSNYGSDPNYQEDKIGTEWSEGEIIGTTTFKLDTSNLDALQASGIAELNKYLGLSGSDSNGTVNVLKVNQTAEVMYFDFKGTGFEILSRTTDEQYAVINVEVYKCTKDEEGNDSYTLVKQKPVITESKGGDLYQVPIISITDLPHDNYRVSVKAAGSTETKIRVLYIDGIRIYGPLDDDKALEYYNPEEYQAKFYEIKQLIKDGNTIYSDISDSGDELMLVTGTTMVEDVSGNGAVLASISSVEEYMQVGPNNEIYLDGNGTSSVIAFFLTPDEKTPEAARTIEIGAHRKVDDQWSDTGYVNMVYGPTADAILKPEADYTVSSGTEQYYSIDVKNLVKDSDGRYLVMIGTNGSDGGATTLALTNLKISGYSISFAEKQLQTVNEAGTLSDDPVVREVRAIRQALMAQAPEEEVEVDTTPINENLTINSASLKASSIVSGKVATLTVKASADASSIVVTGPDGTEVTPTREQTKVSGDTVTFLFMWKVTGSRGDVLDYSIRVFDKDGLASVNTESVSVTIK